jgi:hypothetical protein
LKYKHDGVLDKTGQWIMSRNIIFVLKIILLFEIGFLSSSDTGKQNAVSTVENERKCVRMSTAAASALTHTISIISYGKNVFDSCAFF